MSQDEPIVTTIHDHGVHAVARIATSFWPIHTVSAANVREHWARRARRVKSERQTALMLARVHLPRWSFPLEIRLTRVAPRALDDDNLRGAMKALRDGIADAYGVKDNDPRINWHYDQMRPSKGCDKFGLYISVRGQPSEQTGIYPEAGVQAMEQAPERGKKRRAK